MADWDVVSQTPASGASDPWAVVSQKSIKTRDQEISEANLQAQHERLPGFADAADFASSLVTGAAKTASNIGSAIAHPIETAKAIPGALARGAQSWIKREMDPVGFVKDVGTSLRNTTPTQAGEQLGSLAMGGAAGKAAGVVGDLVGPAVKAAVSTPKAAPPMVAAARKAGYVLKPSEAGAPVGTLAEGMTGSPRLSIEASLKNQPVTNKLAAQEVGVPAGRKLTRDALRTAAKPHQDVYREMEQLGDVDTDPQYAKDIASIGRVPGKSFTKVARNADVESLREQYSDKYMDAQDAVFEIRELRFKAKKNLDLKQIDPEKIELGKAQRQVADAIEDQLERHAVSIGENDLVQRFRDARVSLAKLNTVRDALVGSTGDVSAPKLARLQERGQLLSGNLKLIADVADHFGEVMREAPKIKNKIPLTVLDASAGITGGALTAAHSPAVGIPLMAAAAARPLARKYLLSNRYQNRLSPGPKPFKRPTTNQAAAVGAGFTLADLDQEEGK